MNFSKNGSSEAKGQLLTTLWAHNKALAGLNLALKRGEFAFGAVDKGRDTVAAGVDFFY